MPVFQQVLPRLNELTTAERLLAFKREREANGKKGRIDIRAMAAKNRAERAFLKSLPPGFDAMLRALFYSNLERRKPLGITFAWMPAYDFELRVWECEDTAVSVGGITVMLGSRYPLDAHPAGFGKKATRRVSKKGTRRPRK